MEWSADREVANIRLDRNCWFWLLEEVFLVLLSGFVSLLSRFCTEFLGGSRRLLRFATQCDPLPTVLERTVVSMSISLSSSTGVKFSSSAQAAAEKGMRKILELHSREELAKLCDELGLPDDGLQKEEIIQAIFSEELKSVADYRRVMSLMWEGVVLEYLMSEFGMRVKSFNIDPKRAAIRKWQESAKSDLATPVGSFGRIYVPITTNRLQIRDWTDDGKVVRSTMCLGTRC